MVGLESMALSLAKTIVQKAAGAWIADRHTAEERKKELMLAAVFVTVLLVCCGLTHWCIEAPMQRLGRRVASWLDARFGPDTRPPAWHANRARSIRPSNRTRSARSM